MLVLWIADTRHGFLEPGGHFSSPCHGRSYKYKIVLCLLRLPPALHRQCPHRRLQQTTTREVIVELSTLSFEGGPDPVPLRPRSLPCIYVLITSLQSSNSSPTITYTLTSLLP